jgi:hypothetical protein
VLLKRVYYECLGILLNAVLLRVLVEIENQEDISEEASHRLNDLCKMLHDLEELFRDGEDVSLIILVHHDCSDQAHDCSHGRSLQSLYMFLYGSNSSSCRSCSKPPWSVHHFARNRTALNTLTRLSQADIMYLFNEGHLVDFSSTELNKLIRALFADSQLRQRNLDTIARGPSSPSAQLP